MILLISWSISVPSKAQIVRRGRRRLLREVPIKRREGDDFHGSIRRYLYQVAVIGVLAFLTNQYYSTLTDFEELKWEMESQGYASRSLTNGVDSILISIYKFGPKDLENAKVRFVLFDTSQFSLAEPVMLMQYERGFLNLFYNPPKYRTHKMGPGLDERKASIEFIVPVISSDWIYELSFNSTKKGIHKLSKELGRLEVSTTGVFVMDHEGINIYDWLRLNILAVLGLLAMVWMLAILWPILRKVSRRLRSLFVSVVKD
ncbi:MAG: hypothetical protein HY562_07640 [Ignavibacteriales bacterium]|nr:hypothetical protein [Ignavibacteriales bacterium]